MTEIELKNVEGIARMLNNSSAMLEE